MSDSAATVADFYDRHPINLADILARLRERHGSFDGLAPADLYEFDQDHYGGLPANDALAEAGAIGTGSRVLDICAGMGGPARYLADRFDARVVGLDLTVSRVVGARSLTELVGLSERCAFVAGDAQRLPFADGSFDTVMGQEAWLHVPDKAALLADAHRVLAPGGRIAFTDWIAGEGYDADAADLMREGITAQDVATVARYRALLADAGFGDVSVHDLSADWVPILQSRRDMYDRLRTEALERTGVDEHADYCRFYHAFVGLVESGVLGGARFSART